jgi:hypothetical protein
LQLQDQCNDVVYFWFICVIWVMKNMDYECYSVKEWKLIELMVRYFKEPEPPRTQRLQFQMYDFQSSTLISNTLSIFLFKKHFLSY